MKCLFVRINWCIDDNVSCLMPPDAACSIIADLHRRHRLAAEGARCSRHWWPHNELGAHAKTSASIDCWRSKRARAKMPPRRRRRSTQATIIDQHANRHNAYVASHQLFTSCIAYSNLYIDIDAMRRIVNMELISVLRLSIRLFSISILLQSIYWMAFFEIWNVCFKWDCGLHFNLVRLTKDRREAPEKSRVSISKIHTSIKLEIRLF